MHDFAIIGGGAGGINAAIYAARRGLKVALFEPGPLGGIINTTPVVENYMGYTSISGPDIAKKYEEHVRQYSDVDIITEKVTDLIKQGDIFTLTSENGQSYQAQAVLISTGAAPRKLEVPGEEQYAGKGVSYCAICDAPLFKGKKVAVVGGGDSAVTAALLVADVCPEVVLIHRRTDFRAEEALMKQLQQRPNIKLELNKIVVEVKGSKFMEKLILQDVNTKATEELDTKGLFVYIGHIPASDLARQAGATTNEHGFIPVSEKMETNVSGLYAAGDVRQASLAQLVTSAADGCAAALAAAEFVKRKPIKARA